MITQAELKELLTYNPETGEFTWNKTGKGREEKPGTINNHGRLVIMINYKRHLAHRLAWLYVHGVWPREIDHIDRNPLNNRIANLRDVLHSQNSVNTKTRSDNKYNQRGVCWDKQKLKWKVQISVSSGKRIAKHFVKFEDAAAFYKAQAEKTFGDYLPIENKVS